MAFTDDDLRAFGLDPTDSTTLDAVDAVDQGLLQGQRNADLLKREESKYEEKLRRVEQSKARKLRDLSPPPVVNPADDDWDITKAAKGALNTILPRDWEVGIDQNGQRYNAGNKTFNNDDMSNTWDNIQEDPYGDSVLYYTKVEDGFEDDGVTPRDAYKIGYSSVSAYDRYKDQLTEAGIKVIGEKRFNNAEGVENAYHGNEDLLKDRLLTRDQARDPRMNSFGSGGTELYSRDVLGLDIGMDDESYAENFAKSKALSDQALAEYRPNKGNNWARAFGSGAINLAGLVTKLVGPTELGQRLMDEANDITGYSDTDMKRGGKLFRRGIRQLDPSSDFGSAFGGIGDILDAIVTGGPEVFLQSAPEMLAIAGATMATGIGGGALASSSVAARTAVPILGMATLKTNDTLDKRKELNNGREATGTEVASTFLVEAFATGLDYGAFRFITKGWKPGDGLKNLDVAVEGTSKTMKFGAMLDKAIPEGKTKMVAKAILMLAKPAGRFGAKTGVAAGAEAGQELTTEVVRTLNEEFGTELREGMSFEEILSLPENQKRLSDAISLGAIGGGAPGMVGGARAAISGTASDMQQNYSPIYQKVRNGLTDIEGALVPGATLKGGDKQKVRDSIKEASYHMSEEYTVNEKDEEIGYQSGEEIVAAVNAFLEYFDSYESVKESFTREEYDMIKGRAIKLADKMAKDSEKAIKNDEEYFPENVPDIVKDVLKETRKNKSTFEATMDADEKAELDVINQEQTDIEEEAAPLKKEVKKSKKAIAEFEAEKDNGDISDIEYAKEEVKTQGAILKGFENKRAGDMTPDMMAENDDARTRLAQAKEDIAEYEAHKKVVADSGKELDAINERLAETKASRRTLYNKTYDRKATQKQTQKAKFDSYPETTVKEVGAKIRAMNSDDKVANASEVKRLQRLRLKIKADATKKKNKPKQPETTQTQEDAEASPEVESTPVEDTPLGAWHSETFNELEVTPKTPLVSKKRVGGTTEKSQAQKKLENKKHNVFADDELAEESFLDGGVTEGMGYTAKQRQNKKSATNDKKARQSFVDKIKASISGDTLFSDKSKKRMASQFKKMFPKSDASKIGGSIRIASIAMKFVLDDIKSNVDRANTKGRETSLYASRQNIAKEIGRTIYDSYGLQLVQTNKSSNVTVDDAYIELGNLALEILEDAGMIDTLNEGETTIDPGRHERVDEDGVTVDYDARDDDSKMPMLEGSDAIFITGNKLKREKNDPKLGEPNTNMYAKGHKDNLSSKTVKSPYIDTISRFMRLMNVGNERIPEPGAIDPEYVEDPSKQEDIEADGRKLSEPEQNTIKEIQTKGLHIDPEVVDIFDDLANQARENTITEILDTNPVARILFGLFQTEDQVIETEKQNVEGHKISRTSNAEAMLDAIITYQDAGLTKEEWSTLFVTYFTAVNARLHQDEVAFNFQADNVTTRHIMKASSEEQLIENEEELDAYLRTIVDELSYGDDVSTIEDIMYYTEPSQDSSETQSIMNGINIILGPDNEMIPITEVFTNDWLTDPTTSAFMNAGKSPVQMYMLAKMVRDVRNAVNTQNGSTKDVNWKDLKIRTKENIGFDGNTSGLVNKLLNMLGGENHDAILRTITELIVPAEDGTLSDGYMLLANQVIKLIEEKKAAFAKRPLPDNRKNIKELDIILKFLEETNESMRELSKYPMMNDLYGQMVKSMSAILGNNLASKMFVNAKEGKAKAGEVRKMIADLTKISEMDPAKATFKDKKTLSDAIGASLGAMFGEALKLVNANIEDAYKPLEKAYGMMHNLSRQIGPNNNLSLRSPFAIVYSRVHDKRFPGNEKITADEIKELESSEFNYSIEKRKNTQQDIDDDRLEINRNVRPTRKEFQENPNSFKVMPLHAMDSGILLLAYAYTNHIMREKGIEIPGSMSVHDALYGTTAYAVEFRKQYNNAAFDMAKEYDLASETLVLIDSLIADAKKKKNLNQKTNRTIKDLEAQREIIAKDSDTRQDTKRKAIEKLEADGASVFGTFKNKLPEDGIVKRENTTKPTPKPEPEVTPEPEIIINEDSEVEVEPETESKADKAKETFQKKQSKQLNDALKALTSKDNNPANREEQKRKAIAILEAIKLFNDAVNPKELEQNIDTMIAWINKGDFTKSKNAGFWFQPATNTIEIPLNDTTKTAPVEDVIRNVAHEVEHNVQYGYIKAQLAKKPADRDKSVKVVAYALDKLLALYKKNPEAFNAYEGDLKDAYGQNTKDRLNYVLTRENYETQLFELMAIYRTHQGFREAVNKEALGNKRSAVVRFINSVKEILAHTFRIVPDSELSDGTVDSLVGAMNNIVYFSNQYNQAEGTTFDEDANPFGAFEVQDFDETMRYKKYKGKRPLYFLPYEDRISTFNLVTSRMIKVGMKDTGKWVKNNKFIQKWHKKGMKNSDSLYHKTAEVIHDRFEPGTFASRTLSYMNLNDRFDEIRMRQYETALQNAQQARNRIDTEILHGMKESFNKSTKGMKKKEVDSLGRIFDNSLVFALNDDKNGKTILDEILQTTNKADRDALIDLKAAELVTYIEGNTNSYVINNYNQSVDSVNQAATDIAKYYDTRELGSLSTNSTTDTEILSALDDKTLDSMTQLIALKQIQLLEQSDIDTLGKFKGKASKGSSDSYKDLMAASFSNYNMSFFVDKKENGKNQLKFENATGSHINFAENYEFEHFSEEKRVSMEDKGAKWIILQQPDAKRGITGVAARIRRDFGFVAGLASASSLNSDGVSIDSNTVKGLNKKANNIMRVGSEGNYQYKIILTKDMLSKLEINDHPVSSMMKANGHNTQVFESLSMIKHMMNNERTAITNPVDARILENLLLAKKKGGKAARIPYFLDFRGEANGLNLDDYPEIKRHYGEAKYVTNVLGFNNKVNMVHKDVEDQVLGYVKTPFIHPDNKLFHQMESILRNLVTLKASHVVMGNPEKILGDIATNSSILLINNVPLTSALKYGKEASNYMPEMARMRNKFLYERFKLFGMKETDAKYASQKKKVDALEAKIDKHPFSAALKHGFLQSLSTDLLIKNKDNLNDLQKRANEVFHAIDTIPGAHTAIMKVSNASGWTIEQVMAGISYAAPKNQSIQEYTQFVRAKFKDMNKKEDVAGFLSEIVATPGQSEILRLGGAAMLSADVISKWILYKHTIDMYKELNRVNKGNKRWKQLSESDMDKFAGQLAVNSFINYMTNLPREFDTAADIGLFMFPHFTLKIQKVIYGMVANRLFGTATSFTAAYLAGQEGAHILASVVPIKNIGQFSVDSNVILPAEIGSIIPSGLI